MKRFNSVFKNSKAVIGMIHVGALPVIGYPQISYLNTPNPQLCRIIDVLQYFQMNNVLWETGVSAPARGLRGRKSERQAVRGVSVGAPKYEGSVQKLVDVACGEAEIYKTCGVGGVMIENMHDIPYTRPADFLPEVISVMTRVACEIRKVLHRDTPCGIQVLAGGNKEAVSIAKACDFQFIRAECYVFSHVGDEGFLEASAGPLLRYRRSIDADSVLVFGDIKKKHSAHQITSDVTIEETAKAAEFFLSDGVILTGSSTGSPADRTELSRVKAAVDIPVLIGSGVTAENLHEYMEADAFIVGSHFKEGGRWQNGLSADRIKRFLDIFWTLQNHEKKYSSKT